MHRSCTDHDQYLYLPYLSIDRVDVVDRLLNGRDYGWVGGYDARYLSLELLGGVVFRWVSAGEVLRLTVEVGGGDSVIVGWVVANADLVDLEGCVVRWEVDWAGWKS